MLAMTSRAAWPRETWRRAVAASDAQAVSWLIGTELLARSARRLNRSHERLNESQSRVARGLSRRARTAGTA
jgi:hypothetical protein